MGHLGFRRFVILGVERALLALLGNSHFFGFGNLSGLHYFLLVLGYHRPHSINDYHCQIEHH